MEKWWLWRVQCKERSFFFMRLWTESIKLDENTAYLFRFYRRYCSSPEIEDSCFKLLTSWRLFFWKNFTKGLRLKFYSTIKSAQFNCSRKIYLLLGDGLDSCTVTNDCGYWFSYFLMVERQKVSLSLYQCVKSMCSLEWKFSIVGCGKAIPAYWSLH